MSTDDTLPLFPFLVAPSPPAIRTTGFVETTIVKAGTEIELTCESRGGNPLADVSKTGCSEA